MATMHTRLQTDGLTSHVVVSPAISALLDVMEIVDAVPGNPESGHVEFQVATNALGVFDLNITPPLTPLSYVSVVAVEE